MAEPWERITEGKPKESNEAYAAALAYFELGPGRSLPKLAARLAEGTGAVSKQHRSSIGVSGHIRAWCAKYRWVERAKAYDAHHNRIRLDATAQVVEARAKSDVETALEREAAIRERHWLIYDQVTARLVKALRDDPDRVEGLDALLATYIKAMPVGDRAVAMALPNGVVPTEQTKADVPQQRSNPVIREGVIAMAAALRKHQQGEGEP